MSPPPSRPSQGQRPSRSRWFGSAPESRALNLFRGRSELNRIMQVHNIKNIYRGIIGSKMGPTGAGLGVKMGPGAGIIGPGAGKGTDRYCRPNWSWTWHGNRSRAGHSFGTGTGTGTVSHTQLSLQHIHPGLSSSLHGRGVVPVSVKFLTHWLPIHIPGGHVHSHMQIYLQSFPEEPVPAPFGSRTVLPRHVDGVSQIGLFTLIRIVGGPCINIPGGASPNGSTETVGRAEQYE